MTESSVTFETVKEPSVEMHVEIGSTVNLGNYESVRVTIGVRRSCTDNPEALKLAYEDTKTWITTKIAEIRKEVGR